MTFVLLYDKCEKQPSASRYFSCVLGGRTRSHTELHIVEIYLYEKNVDVFHFWLMPDKNNGHITWRLTYIVIVISVICDTRTKNQHLKWCRRIPYDKLGAPKWRIYRPFTVNVTSRKNTDFKRCH
jgi:hypothetical protein